MRALLRTLLIACFLFALLGQERTAQAQVQVSDQFTHVAKELAKRFVRSELLNACDHKTASGPTETDDVCATLVGSVSDLFSMAIDGNLDATRVGQALRDEFSKLVEATATEILRAEVQRLLAKAAAPGGSCSAAALPEPIATCFIARAYKGNAGAVHDCDAAQTALVKTWTACGGPPDALRGQDVPALIRTVRDKITEASGYDQSVYLAAMLLTQIADVADRPAGTLYALSRSVAQEQEIYLAAIARPDAAVFSDDQLKAVLSAPGACAQHAAIVSRIDRWKQKRAAVFSGIAHSIARMRQPTAGDLNEIPDDLPSADCQPADAPFAKEVKDFVKYAHTYRVDVDYAARLQQVLLPAMLVAILADYIRTQDDAMFLQDVRDFSLQAFARVVAATDGDGLDCTRGDGRLVCTPIGATSPSVTVPLPPGTSTTNENMNTFEHLLEERHTPDAARRTCVYQAAAALVSGSFPTISGMPSVCRMDANRALKDTVLDAYLEPVPNATGLARWKDDRFLASVVPGTASLRIDATTARSGFEFLRSLLPRLAASASVNVDAVNALEDAVQSLELGLTDQARRQLLLHASDAVRPEVTIVLDTHLASLTACQHGDGPDLKCSVRLLVEAAYDPVMTYVSAPSTSQADTSRIVAQLYVRLDELDPLGATPILFNVGPGATVLTRDGTTGHLTLLDKIGGAWRWGDRHQWELGFFAGGFIDAIIRKSVGATDAEPYWLLGTTIGRRQFSRGVPLGFELHAGAALPFDLSQTGDRIAFAWGGALIVPADIAFGGNK